MRAPRPNRFAAGFSLATFLAMGLWFGAPLAADGFARPMAPGASQEPDNIAGRMAPGAPGEPEAQRVPREERLRSGRSFDGDLRSLPQTRDPVILERPEREGPEPNPQVADTGAPVGASLMVEPSQSFALLAAPAPAPAFSFDGLDRAGWGSGYPPDTNGDAGPEYYIQAINSSIGIFRKSDGARVAAFTFNTFMSQGAFGNLCDTDNLGHAIVLYDTFEDRWIISDSAYQVSAGAVVNPPGAFQCIAASKSGDPVAGGWNFYSINTSGGLGDYPKLGIWPDGLYMSVNMFGYPAGAAFQNPRVYAFNKAQMYGGAPVVQVVSFDAPAGDFTILPANARLQTGTPPPGTPNYFVSTWQFVNALSVYKFHVDWNSISLSTFTGPTNPVAATSRPSGGVANAPSLGGNDLDPIQIRAMMQNQYSNIAGVESLWNTHTVRRQDTSGFAAPRWYQVNVTGGTVAPAIPQAATWDPDGANVMHRFVPSVAVDRAGNMALGYSTSSSTTKPAIKYAGRLADDPVNTFSQTEQVLVQGDGTQTNTCGSTAACTRWGAYSAMTLDPDGCTFWFTSQYYKADGGDYQTRVGAFNFPACTPVTNGTLQGVVTTGPGVPLAGATVTLGTRTATTDASGFYAFTNLPAGTHPSVTASLAGYASQTFVSIAVSEASTTTRDFSLGVAPAAACLTDTTQADFQAGVAAGCDLTSAPGDVTLLDPLFLNQQQLQNSGSGSSIVPTQWLGQTFVPTVTGKLVKLDLSLFCFNCSGANPDVIVEVRPTAAGLPTSTVLATTTIPGFSSGAIAFYSATFATPATLVAGTQYAYSLRIIALRTGTYAATYSSTAAAYGNGSRVVSVNNGATWFVFGSGTPATARDLVFKTYMSTGFLASGTFVSSTKDANPAHGATPTWGTMSWTATVPAPATQLQFQAAASNSPDGPFDFVGPDGTATSFFTSSPASLSQFDGKRYLKYQALLRASGGAVTPTLNDVTICFANVQAPTALSLDPATGPYLGTTTLTAALTVAGTGLVGKPIAFTLNGASVGTAITNGVGVATLSGVSLAGLDGGTYPGAVTASFAGELGYVASTASSDLTVTPLAQEITFPPISGFSWKGGSATLAATAGSGLDVSYSVVSGPCLVSGSTLTATAAGTCAIAADQAGNRNYTAAPQVTASAIVDRAAQVITFAALANRTYGGADVLLSAGSSSGLTVSFAVAGACTLSGGAAHITGAGACDVTASQAGDANYTPADPVTRSFAIARAALTVTADNKIKVLNTVNPPLTGILTGVVAGDGITATYTTTAGTGSPVGFYPIVPVLADPNARLGNYTVQSLNGTLSILYAAAIRCDDGPGHQILPPIKADGSSVFKPKSSVSVKFRVCDARGNAIGTPGVVASFKLIQIIRGSVVTTVSLDPESEKRNGGFRFDDEDGIWIFHLSTKGLSTGATYVYRIVLADGSSIDFRFTVNKKHDKDQKNDDDDHERDHDRERRHGWKDGA